MITLSNHDNLVDYRQAKEIDKACARAGVRSATTLYWQTKKSPAIEDFAKELSKFSIRVMQVATCRKQSTRMMATGPGIVMDATIRSGSSEVALWTRNTKIIEKIAAALDAFFDPYAVRSGDERIIPVDFWHWNGRHSATLTRLIECPTWAEISGNYVSDARKELTHLMTVEKPEETGKVMLWHGLPGTGKTYAVRALLQAWKEGYRPSVVVDPEIFFSNSGYLYDVLLDERHDFDPGEEEDGPAKKKKVMGKLLVMEDMPDLLLKESRNNNSHAMARLLNLSDGILGQGLRAVYLFTTNQELDEIDPAFTRPGRCLATIKLEKFGSKDAAEWLRAKKAEVSSGYDVASGMTIAELYSRLHKKSPIGSSEDLEPKKIAGFAVEA